MARKKLGEILIQRGLINEGQLMTALAFQRQWGVRIGPALLAKGFISEADLCKALSDELGIPPCDLTTDAPNMEAVGMLDQVACEKHLVFPCSLKHDGMRRTLVLAMADPLDIESIREIEFVTGMAVKPLIAPPSMINAAIRQYYLGVSVDLDKAATTSERKGQSEQEDMVLLRGGEDKSLELDRAAFDSSHGLDPEPLVRLDSGDGAESGRGRGGAGPGSSSRPLEDALSAPAAVKACKDQARLHRLEKMFAALVRTLAAKQFISKEEFYEAMGEEPPASKKTG